LLLRINGNNFFLLPTELNDRNKQVCPSIRYVQHQEIKYNKKKITTTKNDYRLCSGVFVSKNKRKLNISDSNKIGKCDCTYLMLKKVFVLKIKYFFSHVLKYNNYRYMSPFICEAW
jgi:hypothetical protein